MLTTKEAIEKRRSIRKFKPDVIPEKHIEALLEAARLAPSGCNAQPWRFKVVRDPETKQQLADAAYQQKFIESAPVVIVCCADIQGYLDGTVSGTQDLGKIGALEDRIVKILQKRTNDIKTINVEQMAPKISFNVAIAIEHMVLRALDFDLGTCWVRLLDEKKISDIFGWGNNIYVTALLPVGYPAETPAPRKRKPLQDLLIS
ncbi:MAG: nitroreductase family protein [Desulfobacterales bacterium]|nr:nitroreductase family protein [Desulfobacterales bacterium]